MNDAAAMRPGASYAQARIREPAGDRVLGERFTIGGPGADIVVPGVAVRPEGAGSAAGSSGVVLTVERRKGIWAAEPAPEALVRFNGRPLTQVRDFRRNDVLAIGDAQVVVTDVTRTLLRLDVLHLAGNQTIAPAAMLASLSFGAAGDEDVEIRAPGTLLVPPPATSTGARTGTFKPTISTQRRWGGRAAFVAALVVVLAVVAVLVSMLQSLSLDILPGDAHVRVPGTLVAFRSGDRLMLLPGKHTVRAERDGYFPAQSDVTVTSDAVPAVRLRLEKLPGKLEIDTGGVTAQVSVDGVQVGNAPGLIELRAGQRTITLRSARHIDYTTTLNIAGGGARQTLKATLRPSWGVLQVSADPAGARILIDGVDSGAAPAKVDAPSGVRQIQLTAPGFKTWESSVVLKSGETLTVGPVKLGQPDAHLSIRSDPPGADVTVAGTHRGRTPLELDLPAGINHEVVLAAPGYATWTRSVFADAGKRLSLAPRLEAVLARVTVQGDPADADLLIDGSPRGRTPQSLELTNIEHRIEVRKDGYVAFTGTVTPETGLERTVPYHLVPADRGRALLESAPRITSQIGYVLRLIPVGAFQMGSDRREQGRRPNEGLRHVTLKRPYYFGVTEITNGEFRKFRSSHASGYIDRHSVDLDDQPVTHVTWDDAAEFCNWMSERDGLPPAYEKRSGGFVLRKPVTTGYRLPTEAEWEYAARYAGRDQFHRFTWGDALPVPDQVGNLAGAEAAASLPAILPGYRDDYPVVAPVGKFRPTSLGLHDLSGNVSEWVNDYYISFVDPTPATDPLGPDDGTRHVVRGANWKSATATDLRLAWRDAADGASSTLGFRVARYAE